MDGVVGVVFVLSIIMFIVRFYNQTNNAGQQKPYNTSNTSNRTAGRAAQKPINSSKAYSTPSRYDAFNPSYHNDVHSDLGTPVYPDEADRGVRFLNIVLGFSLVALIIFAIFLGQNQSYPM